MHTDLCDRLGIDVPIIQAPMAGGWTTLPLVGTMALEPAVVDAVAVAVSSAASSCRR